MPLQSETVTIRATVHNLGLVDTQNVLVRFYDGDPASGGSVIGSQTLSTVPSGGSASAQVHTSWATLGLRTITVQVNPDDTIAEANENDNKAQQTLDWTLDKPHPFRFEKAVIPDESERISERLKPPF